MAEATSFVHLRVRTDYSIVDSIVRVAPLMQALLADGCSAVGISDVGNLFALIKVYQAALAHHIKPLLGVDLLCCARDKPEESYLISLLCLNLTGYQQVTRLISRAYTEAQGQPYIWEDWLLTMDLSGVLLLSGASSGCIGQAFIKGDLQRAEQLAKHFSKHFPQRFYLEIQRIGRDNESVTNAALVQLADKLNLPLVATNEVRFIHPKEYAAHEARVCIHEGYTLAESRLSQRYTPQQYLRSNAEMCALFADLPQAIENTLEISKRCTVRLALHQMCLPAFPVPEALPEGMYLEKLAREGLEKRFMQQTDVQDRALYESRLAVELGVIQTMGFAGYFLIVADFISWSKRQGIRVGPGRGSGAGSLVAYTLGITDLDPLAYELLFERFLNPERVSLPDFDVDFCMEGRDRVIDYVTQKYGRDRVTQIITFGSMAAKAVVRDVGRVMGHPYGFVDTLAKLIPFEVGITLARALQETSLLQQRYQEEEEVHELIDLALHLEGLVRNPGKHAGGVVIAPSALTDFTALYCEPGSAQWVSQFDKDDVETMGLVKFDFLGLRTLTIIDWALRAINQHRALSQEAPISLEQLSLQCEKTFALLQSGQVGGVFQLESRGMKELVQRLQPDSFEEIIALVALFRPGPLQSGMVEEFIQRKHGLAAVEYPHPDIEPILKPTYGVILYQEQVMQIAQVLANYTLGSADILRRAMGKKKPEEMAKQRAIFIEGASKREISEAISGPIFDLMEKFAGYGFNKSHSAAYALITYQTAWLKAHYPAFYMAAVLSADKDHTDKIVTTLDTCRQMGLVVLLPSVERSDMAFTVTEKGEICYGLGAIKGVGAAVIEALLATRAQQGAFGDLFAFCQRIDGRKLNRRVVEAFIKSGAMDAWGVERAVLFATIDAAMQAAGKVHQNAVHGQLDLFSMMDKPMPVRYEAAQPWGLRERLGYEKDVLGWYASAHPTSVYYEEWRTWTGLIDALNPQQQKRAFICALVAGVRTVTTKTGKILWIISVEDATGKLELVMFSEVAGRYEGLIKVGAILGWEGEISQDTYNNQVKMVVSACYTPEDLRQRHAKSVSIRWADSKVDQMPILASILKNHPGKHPIDVLYPSGAQAEGTTLRLGEGWGVTPSDALLQALREVFGEEGVVMCYAS